MQDTFLKSWSKKYHATTRWVNSWWARYSPFNLLKKMPFTASMHFALLYGLVFAVSSTAFVSFLWWRTIADIGQQIRNDINRDSRNLISHYHEHSLPGLILSLRERMEDDPSRQALYLLTDEQGNKIIGNLEKWPNKASFPNKWYNIYPSSRTFGKIDRFDTGATIHTFLLPNGYHLLVGRNAQLKLLFQHVLEDALAWVWLLIIILTMGGVLLIRSLIHSMIGTISATTTAIAKGDLNTRMPVGEWGGELDDVARAFNAMLDRISRLMDGIKQVSNSIAHDLRTPITRARARLEEALFNPHSTHAELNASIERAVCDLDNITAIFEALLRISEIETGSRRTAFSEFDLMKNVYDLMELYELIAEEKGLSFSLDVPPFFLFFGDSHLIQQAIANLLDNAIKFSPSGKKIKISLRQEKQKTRTCLNFSIIDEGAGMNKTAIQRATERFYRGESARNSPGLGLGLSTVEAIAHLHDGELQLKNNVNGPGITASLILPMLNQNNISPPHFG